MLIWKRQHQYLQLMQLLVELYDMVYLQHFANNEAQLMKRCKTWRILAQITTLGTCRCISYMQLGRYLSAYVQYIHTYAAPVSAR